MRLVIVTGLSGSGKSIALASLGDAGYYCIDNLPVFLLENFSDQLTDNPNPLYERTAIGIDARIQSESLRQIPAIILGIRNRGIHCNVLFLDASDEVLIKRFNETRRPHPLIGDKANLAQTITHEREILGPIRAIADLTIDTSRTNLHQLRAILRSKLLTPHQAQISLFLQSFGFKHGIPQDADFVFDVRCLPNPYWEPTLRAQTGKDQAVIEFLDVTTQAPLLLERLGDYLHTFVPCFEQEGVSYLTIAIGCTGGQHRSVYVAERLARILRDITPEIVVYHRELGE